MNKLIKGAWSLTMLVLMMMLSASLTSCKDDDNPNESDLVGTWVCKNLDEGVSFTICFKNNGTGWMEWSDEDDHYTFEYSTNNGKIYFEDDYEYWVCEYSIKGNKLTIYGNPWGEDDDINIVSFTRK